MRLAAATVGLLSGSAQPLPVRADRQPEPYQYAAGGAFLPVVPLMSLTGVVRRRRRAGRTEGERQDRSDATHR